VIVRKALDTDAVILTTLNDQFFKEAGRDFHFLITSSFSDMFVAEDADEIIGYTGLQYNDWNQTISIIDIFVQPLFRHQGIGARLLKHIIDISRQSGFRCLIAEAPSLNPVLQLYLKHDFRICGYNDRMYSNDAREVAMFLSLDFSK
jgi:GNAT superfamily N-acetyltransferase